MSHGIDVEEFRQGFAAEADENLARITAALLAIERAPTRSHARELAELLRALHTLKGIAGMMGIDPIVDLVHAMESRLREYQRRDVSLHAAALAPVVRGTQAVAAQVRAVVDREPVAPASESLLLELARGHVLSEVAAGADDGELHPDVPDELRRQLSALDRRELVQARAAAQVVTGLRFAPSPERAARGMTIAAVRAAIERVARIVRVVPRTLPRDSAAPGGLEFLIVAVADGPAAALAQAAGLDDDARFEVFAPATVRTDPPVDDGFDRAAHHGVVRVEVARLDVAVDVLAAVGNGRTRLRARIRALAEAGVDVRALAAALDEEGRQLRRLRTALLGLRMVPIREVLASLPLMIRGLRTTTGKDVRLELDVGDTELDKTVADRLLPALVHLMRNAIDHGIEDADTRAAAGKPATGTIGVRAIAGSTTHLDIEIADDGAGIDPARVAARSGRARVASDDELLAILTTPGFSTRDVATTVSGRGVGLDVVRRTIEALGGTLGLDNLPGRGTTWRIHAPLTVALVDAFACEAGRQRYLVPIGAVEAIVDLDEAPHVATPTADRSGRAVTLLSTRGALIPLVSLRQSLGLREPSDDRKALVVRLGRERCAFAVSRMLGRHEVIVRPLVDPLVQAAGVAGSADVGDGQPTLVLDLRALGQRVAGVEAHA